MKKFGAFLALIGLYLQSTALAWVGGPYSFNTYDGVTGGNFQYTIRGGHLNGMARFSQNTQSGLNSEFGDSIVWYRGITFYGESYGFVDYEAKLASGITNGNASGTDLANPAAVLRTQTGTGFGVFNGVRYSFGNPLFGGDFQPGRAQSKLSVCNIEWSGELTTTKPNPRFKGKGSASVYGEGILSFAASAINQTIYTGAAGSILVRTPTDFAENMRTVKVRIFGGRISTAPFGGSLQFQQL